MRLTNTLAPEIQQTQPKSSLKGHLLVAGLFIWGILIYVLRLRLLKVVLNFLG
jgi:hypothetical protein